MLANEAQPPATEVPVPRTAEAARPGGGRPGLLPAGWPIAVAVAGYPLWWAIGIKDLIFPLAAVPLAWQLLRSRRVRVPPGFWLWGLFLLWVLASALAINLTAPGTLPPSGTGRYLAFAVRFSQYVAVTVFMLYIGNVAEERLPRARVIRWMGLLTVWVVVLGWLALAFPELRFRTPLAGLVPGGDGETALAQVQPVLGYSAPRPAAPFAYTNAWGSNLTLLLVWFAVGWMVLGSMRRRWLGVLVAVASVVPIVYSLNRGVWIAIGLAVVYVGVRLALRGRLVTIGAAAVLLCFGSTAFVASPLSALVTQRAEAGHSDNIRTLLAEDALRAAVSSPVLGYGTTRDTQGSGSSIAVGQSPDCPRCGNRVVGSTGQLWLVLIAQGFVGAALYVGYLGRSLWAFRRDHSPVGIAGSLVLLLILYFSLFYTALSMPLAVAFISIALMWRGRQTSRPPGAAGRVSAKAAST